MSAVSSFAIPPDAVRVWRGFRASSMELADFFSRLNTVFVPATVELQINAGLDGYIPAVPAGLAGKPDGVPDDTAILFWDSQQTYHDGFNTLAVRTYTLTHGGVYAPNISRADFPLFFAGTLAADQPYYLVPKAADWMKGTVRHLIAGRPTGVTPAQFRAQLGTALAGIQAHAGLAGAIACAGDEYLVYWELLGDSSGSGDDTIETLAHLTAWNYGVTALLTSLDIGLWDSWPGMQIVSGDSLNVQFRRRWER
ncbi:MAG: hypothetical protein ACJ8CR_04840 [Roseiflexaceae bacterium]